MQETAYHRKNNTECFRPRDRFTCMSLVSSVDVSIESLHPAADQPCGCNGWIIVQRECPRECLTAQESRGIIQHAHAADSFGEGSNFPPAKAAVCTNHSPDAPKINFILFEPRCSHG